MTVERIFDPYFTTRPAGEGTGLGLAAVPTIIKSHDGALEIASTPGRGTTFEIYLPIAEGPRDGSATTSAATAGSPDRLGGRGGQPDPAGVAERPAPQPSRHPAHRGAPS